MRLKRKDLIIITVLIAMCLVTLVGSSYALFTRTFTSTKKISVQAGTLKVDFAEGDRINLSNVAPMSDSDGMNTTPYTFTITNSGSVAAYYTIRNEEDSSNTLNNKYIKYRLISDSFDSGIKTLDTIGNGYYMLSLENTLAVGKSITYKLYLWLSSEADNDAQNKTYQSKIVVQSTTNSISDTVATTLLKGVGDNGSIDASDPEQTFITGTNPNNYIWYSGKLWRAVSIDSSDNSVKLITQWGITAIPYGPSGNGAFETSYMKEWLNDTSTDGFLSNLREPEKFIKMTSNWNATVTDQTTKPQKTTLVTAPVGLLNLYEYTMSYNGISAENGYLNDSLWWNLLNSTENNYSQIVMTSGAITLSRGYSHAVRPAINLKPTVKIVSGIGTSADPYRLENDHDENLSGMLLSTRYSGEYINFGLGENSLYRIVSHETLGHIKITSATPLKEKGEFDYMAFDANLSVNYSANITMGSFLNNEFLTSLKFISEDHINMIEDSYEWYLGTVSYSDNPKFAKYSDNEGKILTFDKTTAKIGMLRLGELLASQQNYHENNFSFRLITPFDKTQIRDIGAAGDSYYDSPSVLRGMRPTMNLKSNVVITSGDGTKNNPFEVKLAE